MAPTEGGSVGLHWRAGRVGVCAPNRIKTLGAAIKPQPLGDHNDGTGVKEIRRPTVRSQASDAALFGRAASVVRNRGNVTDVTHFDTGAGKGADGRFAAGARPWETRTSYVRRPESFALLRTRRQRSLPRAANGVPLREPRKPSEPELDQASVFPIGSLNVMIVLLNVAWMWQTPIGTCFFSFFFNLLFRRLGWCFGHIPISSRLFNCWRRDYLTPGFSCWSLCPCAVLTGAGIGVPALTAGL